MRPLDQWFCSKQAFFEFRKKNRRALAAHASSWTEIEPIPSLRRKIAKKLKKRQRQRSNGPAEERTSSQGIEMPKKKEKETKSAKRQSTAKHFTKTPLETIVCLSKKRGRPPKQLVQQAPLLKFQPAKANINKEKPPTV